MPETGQTPIRVYEDHDAWYVDYGEGVTREYDSREEAESAADAVAQEEEREVVVENSGQTADHGQNIAPEEIRAFLSHGTRTAKVATSSGH